MKKIPITTPSISNLEIDYVQDAIANGWGERCYDYIKRFEKLFSEYLGVKYSLATSSCTGAIHLALLAMGVKKGDEVILPDITWISSVEPIIYIGAKPVFVDVLPNTWCIDPKKLENAITKKTKAINVVHLYGNMAEMDDIISIAKKHGLKILEDAAEAIGSEYKGKKSGSMGDVGVFSFHGTKTISTGEGGMLVTNNKNIYEKALILNDHGRDPKTGKLFWMEQYGYKYKMSNLQAAMGCAQIKRLDKIVDKKRKIFSWYKDFFNNFHGLQMNEEQPYVKNSFWMPTIIIEKSYNINRDKMIKDFNKEYNIMLRPFFYPLSFMPMFKRVSDNKNSYDLYYRGINLPSFYDLKKKDVEYICNKIKDYLKM